MLPQYITVRFSLFLGLLQLLTTNHAQLYCLCVDMTDAAAAVHRALTSMILPCL